ncbi:MAG: dephospho-CoA kinase, partial [Gammaproteobacteria bacterium]|nr:dephospho-CoA kinase [Gammaproteobacteria bacterium]
SRSGAWPDDMLRVGLTGGIASGKSEAAAAFARLGVPVVDADAISRELTAAGAPGLAQLVAALGTQIMDRHGQLQRAALRQRLFADAPLRAQVQAVLHPLIVRRMQAALEDCQAPYAMAVIPLLVEAPTARALVDRVLVVDCPEPLQLSRLMSRDGENEATARAILATQASRTLRVAAGDDILINTGTLHEMVAGVAELHQLYMHIADPQAQSRWAARPPMSGTGI